jgi:hypothetical protein
MNIHSQKSRKRPKDRVGELEEYCGEIKSKGS